MKADYAFDGMHTTLFCLAMLGLAAILITVMATHHILLTHSHTTQQHCTTNLQLKPGESLFVVKTLTLPPFLQLLPDPFLDVNNPRHLLHYGTIHPRFTALLREIMQDPCAQNKVNLRICSVHTLSYLLIVVRIWGTFHCLQQQWVAG